MNIVLDVNIVVDICAKRNPFYDDSLAARQGNCCRNLPLILENRLATLESIETAA